MARPALDERTKWALAAVEAAGAEIRRIRETAAFSVLAKDHGELVTTADLASHQIIAEAIRRRDPAASLLSEEGEHDAQDWAGAVWIADPIDGTVNFVHGSAQVAISLAYVVEGRARIGLVHAPFRDETYLGLRGGGAWRRVGAVWTRLKLPSTPPGLSGALIGTGFPHDRRDLGPLLSRLGAVLRQCRDVRRLGSPCLDICRVATGRLDAYYETIFPWDMAAAALVAREAGALTGPYADTGTGLPPDVDGVNLLVAPPPLFDSLRNLLRSIAE